MKKTSMFRLQMHCIVGFYYIKSIYKSAVFLLFKGATICLKMDIWNYRLQWAPSYILFEAYVYMIWHSGLLMLCGQSS